VRERWRQKAGLVSIDGKTSLRSQERSDGTPRFHSVSAFHHRPPGAGAGVRARQGKRPCGDPELLERLGAEDGLTGTLVSIDAIVTNAAIAGAILNQGADYLLAVIASQRTLRAEVEAAFAAAEALDTHLDLVKSDGRVEERRLSVLARSNGLTAAAASRASCACRVSHASSAPRPSSRRPAAVARKPAPSALPAPSRQPRPPRQCVRRTGFGSPRGGAALVLKAPDAKTPVWASTTR
jgi:predicted transposase YbfD/YdcC